ncbi:type IV pilus biogenesis/stability protein PilW [Haliea sp. AH-315-K21]|uniref:Type IV pilus biogenesis/stability protein PilW n=1 Tax=SAR86 cluster bacterium TaxID=2030880 RepID=A0A2A5CCA3_9GAMM|nr:type IV pilus biogenesis/stability protein PilW [Haliea sp. AH-315-K21]PCJ41148.1 MAG: type IV pilus biogenesis/stability protein PilW [SAR86 cluster bacterium]
MIQKMVKKMHSLAGSLIIILSVMLSSCVSETTGGFSQADPEETLGIYLQLALGYVEQQDLNQARRHLRNASAIDANNSDVYGIWGLVYTIEGDLDLADESFRRALSLDSDNSQVGNNYAAFLFSNDRFQSAYDQLEAVVQDTEYPGRAQAFENMGLAALQLNQLEDAEYAFNRALQLNSNRIRSTLELAEIDLEQGDIQGAGRYYQSFLTLRQFFNIQQSARSLWVGIRLEQARRMNMKMLEYGASLAELYPDSFEYDLYQQLLND